MTRSTASRAVKAQELTQQKVDFTAEGGPPAGTVAGHPPETMSDAPAPKRRAAAVRAPAGKPAPAGSS